MTTLADIATVLETTEKNVLARAKGLRILPVCERCGGSGRYSFNGTHSNCYGCGGIGMVAPKASQLTGVLELAKATKKNGKFAEYMLFLDANARSRGALDRVMFAWKATRISDAYKWQNAAEYARTGNPEFKRDGDISDFNHKMHGAYQTVQNASRALNPKSETYHQDVITFAATVDTALETIAAANREFIAYMSNK